MGGTLTFFLRVYSFYYVPIHEKKRAHGTRRTRQKNFCPSPTRWKTKTKSSSTKKKRSSSTKKKKVQHHHLNLKKKVKHLQISRIRLERFINFAPEVQKLMYTSSLDTIVNLSINQARLGIPVFIGLHNLDMNK